MKDSEKAAQWHINETPKFGTLVSEGNILHIIANKTRLTNTNANTSDKDGNKTGAGISRVKHRQSAEFLEVLSSHQISD